MGLRHAFDPDHIAAIDNTTRALQSGHRTPQSVGMYFALGHSTVVFAAAVLVVVSARWVGLTGDPRCALRWACGALPSPGSRWWCWQRSTCGPCTR
ncbi:hypothetical protein [Kocuria palustris]|uniref:HoxN/HupN/NixA family nickel/cobalt transporter n=1 Tax=Kocuria palustris TaxID=71999 RepID=UPI003D753725